MLIKLLKRIFLLVKKEKEHIFQTLAACTRGLLLDELHAGDVSGLCAEGWSNGLDYSLLCKYVSVVEEVLNAKLLPLNLSVRYLHVIKCE